MTHKTLLTVCAALLLASGTTVGASDEQPEALELTLSASFVSAKKDVVVRTRVEPDARSRELTIEWVADDLSGGSHAISLDGDAARPTYHYRLRRLSPGNYVVTAVLLLNDGSEVRRTSKLSVIGADGPDSVGAGRVMGGMGRPAAFRPASER